MLAQSQPADDCGRKEGRERPRRRAARRRRRQEPNLDDKNNDACHDRFFSFFGAIYSAKNIYYYLHRFRENAKYFTGNIFVPFTGKLLPPMLLDSQLPWHCTNVAPTIGQVFQVLSYTFSKNFNVLINFCLCCGQ
jgi:hypothetical protein